ncbi:MAG TPA: hypothetical protein VNA32_00285 [Actinomycetota bacterium]|nr:hypothetical protein [Actinomycetota bacterium]
MEKTQKTDRVVIQELYPQGDTEHVDAWTQRLVFAGGQHHIYRQCSIGWHGECSQRELWGEACPCRCRCHIEARVWDMDLFDESEAPEGVTEVIDYVDYAWVLGEDGLWRSSVMARCLRWQQLLRRFGPVTEVLGK